MLFFCFSVSEEIIQDTHSTITTSEFAVTLYFCFGWVLCGTPLLLTCTDEFNVMLLFCSPVAMTFCFFPPVSESVVKIPLYGSRHLDIFVLFVTNEVLEHCPEHWYTRAFHSFAG